MTDADAIPIAAGAVNHMVDQLAACERHAHALAVERDGAMALLAEALERERFYRFAATTQSHEIKDLKADVERLTLLNEDKFRTIQAYCKAADEDRGRIRRLVGILKDWQGGLDSGRIWERANVAIAEFEEWYRGRS
jgi:hypothetical protein